MSYYKLYLNKIVKGPLLLFCRPWAVYVDYSSVCVRMRPSVRVHAHVRVHAYTYVCTCVHIKVRVRAMACKRARLLLRTSVRVAPIYVIDHTHRHRI